MNAKEGSNKIANFMRVVVLGHSQISQKMLNFELRLTGL